MKGDIIVSTRKLENAIGKLRDPDEMLTAEDREEIIDYIHVLEGMVGAERKLRDPMSPVRPIKKSFRPLIPRPGQRLRPRDRRPH